jgi:hypothetical protein
MTANNKNLSANSATHLGGFFDSFVRQIGGVINGR